ncbi:MULTISPECIES: PLP-dependent aminotransferase family protein [Alphaproteobacteria]|uniref:GntR family transcriptional regulator n=2 Tax=Alphaproteobacteria TaxID=28211 RepID=A0A512HD73_9HYPH|nr:MULTISPECIES: PLP-dependent aminotransferase family protein [Alphaproteobacteria]GEO83403.1 GntR family transcriptional regulator [Ciceribacter naphthalenivorans]GLR23024.1 GntR family transcriptional regulator [Ciceribacter naphthalenivorans]GLT05880.1 GntR family transcriptional regulator [Sphingomonas psychrolutea]
MRKIRTNISDWSASVPILPKAGPRRLALYGELRRLIEAGSLPAGSKLPTTRDLAARFGLSRGAAVAAYEMLVADGFAEARVGSGTFVAAVVPALARLDAPAQGRALEEAGPLPGALGCSAADARTIQVFRTLLNRHLMQPSPRHFHYAAPAGSAELREEVAAYLRAARGVNCCADQVVLTSGTQQALDLVIRTVLAPGDPVWIEDPCYPMARVAFSAAGMRLIGVPVDAEGIDPEKGMARAPAARTVYVSPSHQFPLGVTLSMRRRLALIDWAKHNDAFIIEDDYDSEYRFAGPPLSSMQGIDAEGRVIYVGTFSKVLMPGLRIGYLVLPGALCEPLLDVRKRTDRFPSTLAEGALAEFLREGHFAAHVKRARRRVRQARDSLVEALDGSGLDVTTPEQGLHLVAGLPDGCDDVDVATAAARSGFGARALSPMYVDAAPRSGLVIGFSGFPADVLGEAVRRWVRTFR